MKILKGLGCFVLLMLLFGCASAKGLRTCREEITQLRSEVSTLNQRVTELKKSLDETSQALNDLKFGLNLVRKELLDIKGIAPAADQPKISQLIGQLKDETSNPAPIGKELQPYGKSAAAALINALKEPDPRFRTRVEQAMQQMLPEDMVPPLIEALKDGNTRLSSARTLGNLKDASATPALVEYINDDNIDVVLAVAESLMKLKEKRGIPTLIECLKHKDEVKRALAYDILSRSTGLSFGYKPYAPEEDRRIAARRWEDWWLKNGASFQFQ